MATQGQIDEYNWHREICKTLRIGQSTLQHKAMTGTLDAASPTGVRVYTPHLADNAVQSTTDTQVWAVWEEQTSKNPRDSTEAGRLGVPMTKGQFPALDDTQAVIAVAHDDWIKDANGVLYRILNPVISPDLGYWSFEVLRQR